MGCVSSKQTRESYELPSRSNAAIPLRRTQSYELAMSSRIQSCEQLPSDSTLAMSSRIQSCEQLSSYSTDDISFSQTQPSAHSDARNIKDDDAVAKKVLDTCMRDLICYMKPELILDCNLFDYEVTRDIREEKNTSQKNRSIIPNIRGKGNEGYKILKDCLNKTGQSKVVELLERTERGDETDTILEQLRQDMIQNMTLKMKELQEDLIEFFRCQYSSIALSPLIEEEDTPLLTFYQMPSMNLVTFKRGRGGGWEEKTPVEQFRNIFHKGNQICREIYLKADAGFGKTSLSKRLVLTWCQAKNPISNDDGHFSPEEIETMDGFDFVFLLLLRESHTECDVDDLILNHIVSRLEHTKLSLNDLENIISNKKCLVILDGLDEWTHPSSDCKQGWSYLPHRKARKCTVLTTTRPWKLYASEIKNSQIDQTLEIAGLSLKSANALKMKVISHLCDEKDKNELEKSIKSFDTAVETRELTDMETVPLLLMYLLCLWYESIEQGESHLERNSTVDQNYERLGESQCELYSNIIELLLSRTVKKYKHMPILAKPAQNEIPQCFNKHTHCEKFYSLLASLAQLAYRTLFNETRESTLVFDNEIAEECLNKEPMQVCLQSGILSQSKVQGKLTEKVAKVSFAHKSVQEFFAALYMHSASDHSTVRNTVMLRCNSVEDILEMSKVFIFLSGINVREFSLISHKLIDVINEDKITREYRAITNDYTYEKHKKLLNKIQDMYISCVKENQQNPDVKLFHQDIIINCWYENKKTKIISNRECHVPKTQPPVENYFKYIQQIVVQNKEKIRSVSIDMKMITHNIENIIKYFELSDLSNIDKIIYSGEFDNYDVTPLLHKSVKCLALMSEKLQDNDIIDVTSKWHALLSTRFYSLDNLESIHIGSFVMSHDELEKLVKHLSKRIFMRGISLYDLECTGHGNSCDSLSLELSQHLQLQTLGLGKIPLSELNIDATSLEACCVGRLSKPGPVSHFLSSLSAASKLHTFECYSLESTEDIEPVLALLPKLLSVNRVIMFRINLGDREMQLSQEMMNIEHVELTNVTMTASAFCHLVKQMKKLQQTVTVEILDCTITPEDEFETEKDNIKRSSYFRVIYDGFDSSHHYQFDFRKIK